MHFIRLRLTRGNEVVSDNFYMRGLEEVPAPPSPFPARGPAGATAGYNFSAIRTLPNVKVEASSRVTLQGSRWVITTDLRNTSNQPALMVRVKSVREKSGDRILPAISSDNYIALMPGEHRTIRTELENADTRGERPRIGVEGFNVE